MLHNEARELLVQGYEATHDAKGGAKAYSVSKWTVYRLAEQKRKTDSVALRTSQRGRKPVLTVEDKENIQHCIDESPDITIEEIREKLNLCLSKKWLCHLFEEGDQAEFGPQSTFSTYMPPKK